MRRQLDNSTKYALINHWELETESVKSVVILLNNLASRAHARCLTALSGVNAAAAVRWSTSILGMPLPEVQVSNYRVRGQSRPSPWASRSCSAFPDCRACRLRSFSRVTPLQSGSEMRELGHRCGGVANWYFCAGVLMCCLWYWKLGTLTWKSTK